MKKIITIAFTEYANAVRSKAFLINLLVFPLLMAVVILLPRFMKHFSKGDLDLSTKSRIDLSDRRFAVVDYSGSFSSEIENLAKIRNEKFIFISRKGSVRQVSSRFIFEKIDERTGDWEDHVSALSARVRSKDLFAFLLIGKDAMNASSNSNDHNHNSNSSNDPNFPNDHNDSHDSNFSNDHNDHYDSRIEYYSGDLGFQELPEWLDRVIEFQRRGSDQNSIHQISVRPKIERMDLSKKENRIASFAIPAVSMFLLFMMVMSSAPALLSSVLEEKMQKIVECLIASVTPFQLMMGKLIGSIMISITLSSPYLVAIAYVAWDHDLLKLIPPHLFLWFPVFMILAIMIFGSIFLAIGATCNEMQDAQGLMFPVMMAMMIPMMTLMPILESPNGIFARWMSFFPPTTPMILMMRMAVPPGLPMWEILLCVLIAMIFTFFSVMAAGKIFRIGILAQGQNASFAKIMKWLFSK